MANNALAEGFNELLWLDPAVIFTPYDVDHLRALNLPFACGVYPWPGRRGLVCEFQPGTESVRFGKGGSLVPVVSCGLGFALVRREVFEVIAKQFRPVSGENYFSTSNAKAGFVGQAAEDVAFCARARSCGFEIVADTSIRLWRVSSARLSWEDAGSDRERTDDFTLHLCGSVTKKTIASQQTDGHHSKPVGNPFRSPATPLPERFPRIRLYVVTYPANVASLMPTLASIQASDWGESPTVVAQPDGWPKNRESGSRNYKRALEAAATDDCDFALILEDDVRVCNHLRHNLLTNPLVRRDQCNYLSLFMPDLVADPWEREEPHLGYRLAKPRYVGSNQLWTRARVWGSQAYEALTE